MQFSSLARQVYILIDHSLLPFTVASLAWLIIFASLRPISDGSAGPGLLFITHLLLTLPIGLFWAGLFRRLPNPLFMLAPLLILVGIVNAVLIAAGLFGRGGAHELALVLTSVAGASIGWLIWWAGDGQGFSLSRLMSRVIRNPEVLVAAIVFFLAAISLVPINFKAGILSASDYWRGNPGAGYFAVVMAHIYALIKSVILWVPVGLVFGFADLRARLLNWVSAALLTCGLAGLSQLDWLSFQDIIEVACGALGIWAGLWLAKRTLLTELQPAGDSSVLNSVPNNEQAHIEVVTEELSPAGAVTFKQADSVTQSTVPVAQTMFALSDKASDRSLGERVPPVSLGSSGDKAASLPWFMACRALAAIALICALAGLAEFPRFQLLLGVGLVGYLVLLWRLPLAWLVVIPLTLPVLDVAPWTGRFFLDEFDLVMLVTVAAWLWRVPRTSWIAGLPPLTTGLFIAYTGILLISLLVGLLPLQGIDANAFSSYWSQYNGLRVVKGYVWGLLIFLMLATVHPGWTQRIRLLFATGMGAGLLGVVLVSLRERWQYAGLFDFADEYRITGPFSSMHTGGGHIEAYLVFALPFVWYFIKSSRGLLQKLAGAVLILLTMFIITTTIARGAVAALVLMAGVFLAYGVRRLLEDKQIRLPKVMGQVVLVLLAIGVLAVGISGAYFQERFSRVGSDLMTRINHWSDAVGIMDDGISSTVFGMGLGTFPVVYLQHNPQAVPGTYSVTEEGGNSLMRMGSGDTAYLTQRVNVEPGKTYALTMDLRSDAPEAKLHVPLCERHLLHSYRCVWKSFWLRGADDGWQAMTMNIDSGQLGSGNIFSRRYIELTLYNQLPGIVIDIDNVRLLDQSGRELVSNGDFSGGADHWFYKTYSHLPFHIKNLWVSLYFEQGLLGVLLFTALVLAILWQLALRLWQGDLFATTVLASLAGFLGVGLFGSLFDAPRLTLLFFSLLLWGASKRGAMQEEGADA